MNKERSGRKGKKKWKKGKKEFKDKENYRRKEVKM
jgi:hypothetical protein